MNILILTQVLPYPLDSGPKIKTYNVIKCLSKKHKVTLVSFIRNDKADYVRHLEYYCEEVHTVPIRRGKLRDIIYLFLSFIKKQPFIIIRDYRKTMRETIDRLISYHSFDVLHVDQTNMAQYALHIKHLFRLLDAHNALWLLYKRLANTMKPSPKKFILNRDYRLLKRYEGEVCQEFDTIIAVSDSDKIALQKAANTPISISVIPIAIDTKKQIQIVRKPGPYIIHIGTMYWPPNIEAVKWFVTYVFPIIIQHRSDVQFDIIGTRPPFEIYNLKKNRSNINITGYRKDIFSYQERASVMVVPLFCGAGMRVKILNSLAAGIPVVSTTIGCEGIDVKHGRDILIGDSPEDFANQVLKVLNNPILGQELALNGRRLVENKYDYHRNSHLLHSIYSLTGSPKLQCKSI